MGILSRINEAKSKFKKLQSDKSQRANVIKAEKLRELREERIKLEGKANLEKLEARERARIQTAKQNSGLGNKLKAYAKQINNSKPKASRFGASTSGGIQFGGSSSSGGGIDFGGRNTKSDTFSFGGSSKPKTEDKPKPKRIIINI